MRERIVTDENRIEGTLGNRAEVAHIPNVERDIEPSLPRLFSGAFDGPLAQVRSDQKVPALGQAECLCSDSARAVEDTRQSLSCETLDERAKHRGLPGDALVPVLE